MVWWNPHSVMFEVAWCVMLYTSVLALEFSPILFEKLKWARAIKVVRWWWFRWWDWASYCLRCINPRWEACT